MTYRGEVLELDKLKRKLGTRLRKYRKGARTKYSGFADREYYLPTYDELAGLVAGHPVEPADFFGERFDCDDYAFVFKGSLCLHARDVAVAAGLPAPLAVGIAWAHFDWVNGLHAVNVAIDDDRDVYWIEPQDGTIHELDACDGGLELIVF